MDEHPLRAFAPLRILIVDDDAFLAELACDHYRSHGHTVEYAADGAQALQSMARQRPDIVLCDRRMPEMSGAELLETMRARGEEWAAVVFVFVTGLNDPPGPLRHAGAQARRLFLQAGRLPGSRPQAGGDSARPAGDAGLLGGQRPGPKAIPAGPCRFPRRSGPGDRATDQ